MSNSSDIHVIWKDRGYSYERCWKEAFEKAGYTVTDSTKEVDAGGYVLLQGISAGHDNVLNDLPWLEKKKGKKLALVVNAHKLQLWRKTFYDRYDITAGMEFDHPDIYTKYLHVPAGVNQHVYFEKIPYAKRPYEIGFRGHYYKNRNGAVEARKSIMECFQSFPAVQPGVFIWDRDKWAEFLNTIKAIPAVEACYMKKHSYLVNRHYEAAGTRTVQIMYPCKTLERKFYIELEPDHSNLDDVIRQVNDQGLVNATTKRFQEKVLDEDTIEHRVKMIGEWFCQ